MGLISRVSSRTYRFFRKNMSVFPESSNAKIKPQKLEIVKQKLHDITKGGTSQLFFISDFDATMSKHHSENDPNKRLCSSFAVIEEYCNLPKEVEQLVRDNVNKYYPKEMDTSIPEDEKTELMIEWYNSSMGAIAGTKLITPESIKKAVMNAPIVLRDNTDKLIKTATD